MLLSFVASQAISKGDAVALDTAIPGRIRAVNMQNFELAKVVGSAFDTVAAGGLCRVVSKGPAECYGGLEPGRTYYAPINGGQPIAYAEFVNQLDALSLPSAYLSAVGKALTSTTLSVNLSPPVFVLSDSVDTPAPPLTLTTNIAPTNPAVGDTLNANASAGGGQAPLVITYQWQQDLGVITSWTDFPGATSSTFTIPLDRGGWSFRCGVTVTSSDGQSLFQYTGQTAGATS